MIYAKGTNKQVEGRGRYFQMGCAGKIWHVLQAASVVRKDHGERYQKYPESPVIFNFFLYTFQFLDGHWLLYLEIYFQEDYDNMAGTFLQ